MTSPIGLLTVFADLLILLALAAAVASPRVPPFARPLIATFAFACAWLTTAVSDALQPSEFPMFMGGAVIVVSTVAVVVSLHLWTQGSDGGEGGPGGPHDGGGGGPRRGPWDAPQRGGGGDEPGWWPEFERRLALYVADRDREMSAHGQGAGSAASSPSALPTRVRSSNAPAAIRISPVAATASRFRPRSGPS